MGGREITKFTAAAIQYEPSFGDKKGNLDALVELCHRAAHEGARLVVLPEMAVAGYCFTSREEISPYVEPIPGPTTKRFVRLAKSEGCYIAAGLPEVEPATGNYYNSLVLVGPSGLVGKYRKTHAFVSDPKWAKEGDLGFKVWRTELGRISGVICFDSCIFETNRIVALQEADVVCYPSAWLLEKGPAPIWISRAFENGMYYIVANRWSVERTIQFIGSSCIINPDGTIQACADSGNQIVYGEIDLDKVRDKKFLQGQGDKLRDRRPDLYHAISQNTYSWNPLMFWGLYGKDPLPQGKRSCIAVAQFKPRYMDRSENLRTITELILQPRDETIDLIVFPELATTGIPTSVHHAREATEELSTSETVRKLTTLARKKGIYIVIGVAEKKGSQLFNSALLIGAKGLLAKYRKTHLNAEDRIWATAGDRFETFDLPMGRVGLLIGYDAVFPETVRILALKGSDLICVPSAMTGPKPIAAGPTKIPTPNPDQDPVHWFLWRVRAGENNTYLAFSNHIGGEYIGMSGVFGPSLWKFPRHEALASPNREEVVFLTMDTRTSLHSKYPTRVVRAKDLLRLRHPYWYDSLVQQAREAKEQVKGSTLVE